MISAKSLTPKVKITDYESPVIAAFATSTQALLAYVEYIYTVNTSFEFLNFITPDTTWH